MTGASAVPRNPNPGAATGTALVAGTASASQRFYAADGSLAASIDGTGVTVTVGNATAFSSTAGAVSGTRTYAFDGKTVAQRTSRAGVAGSAVAFITGDSVNTAQVMTGPTTGGGTVGITAVKRHTDPGGLTRGVTTTAVGNTAYAAAPAGRTSPGSNASNETGFSAATGYLSGTADTASALTHLGARDYDPVLGIFTAPDPVLDLGDAKNFSPYAYSEHDPVNQADPSGLRPTCDCEDDNTGKYAYKGGGEYYDGTQEPPTPWYMRTAPSANPFLSFLRPAPARSWSLPPINANASPAQFSFPAPAAPVHVRNNNNAYDLGLQWLTGSGRWMPSFGKPHQTFTDGDPFTEQLKSHPHYRKAAAKIAEELRNGTFRASDDIGYKVSGWEGLGTFINDVGTISTGGANGGNLATAFLGSHAAFAKPLGSNSDGSTRVQFTARNQTTLQSAVRVPVVGYEPWYINTVGAAQDAFSWWTWIGAPATQTITWTENIK